MGTAQKIGLRIVIIGLLFVLCNFVYDRYFFTSYLQENGTLLYYQREAPKSDYYYYSASSEFSYHLGVDSNKDRITKILSDNFPIEVTPITEVAHHAGIFKEVIQHLDKSKTSGIIVSLNYRSFSPEWLESHNENALQQANQLYVNYPPLMRRFLVSLKAYEPLSNKQRDERFVHMFETWPLPFDEPQNTIANWCAVEKYGDWRNPQRQLADHYIKNYAYVLNESSPRMADFDRISEIAKEKDLQLIYVIIPENVQEAQELLGSDLIDLIDDNRQFLVNRFHKPEYNQYVLDILDLLEDENFTDRKFPTEHYNFEGRKKVAYAIGDFIKTLPNDD